MAAKSTKPAPAAQKKPASKSAARDKAVRTVLKDFLANPPAGAESGLHSSTATDRWTNGDHHRAVPDGAYQVKGSDWVLSFKGGKLDTATHVSRSGFMPAKVTAIAANG